MKRDKRLVVFVLGALTVLALGLALSLGIRSPEGSSVPVSISPATTYMTAAPPLPPSIDDFIDNCLNNRTKPVDPGVGGGEIWKIGQIDYPRTLTLELGTSGVYVAAVDIRQDPLPPSEVIPGADPKSSRIAVRCVLSARLVGDTTLTVEPDAWVAREFNPAGVLDWSWRVTGKEPGDHQLQLELQPAVVTDDTGDVIAAGGAARQLSTFVTETTVHASIPQTVGHWWTENWPATVVVVSGVAAAITGAVKWGSQFVRALRGFRSSWRGEEQQGETASAPRDSRDPGRDSRD